MPFKLLGIKKSRQYNVMSKDLYVCSVVCLDGSNVDCTLSSESKGSECLENVCQRAGLNQNEFFGLRYYPKGTTDESEMRWVDLDRPLNRQLEKHAASSKVLYLRIMYYVISGVSLITDEATRNYYFLQLKQDIVEGRISCDPKQAVILANYGRIAEFGNHPDRHKSVEYLKSLLSFPKHLIEAGMLEVLTEEVIKHHDEVHDMNNTAAEELYISLCQQLDGYGQETFMARNEDGAEVMLGISVSGVIVGSSGSHKFYPWREIVNVVNHKRTFNIECTDSNQNVGFTLPDAESGRYIWKLCVNQHTFFMNYEQNHASQVNLSLFQNIPENFNDSREDLLSSDDKLYYSSNSHLAIPNSATNLSVNNGSQWMTSDSMLNTNPIDSRTSLQTSTIDVNLPMNPILGSNQWNPSGSNASLVNRAQSSSCLDLANSNANINNNINKERLKQLLPSYRPAPSYETAIQQKYRGSQVDVGQVMYENYGHPQSQLQHYPTPDVTHHSNITGPNYSDASDYALPQRFKMMSVKPPPQYPANRFSSTSTPDLALASHRGLFGASSSPDLVSSRTLLQHGIIPSNPHSVLYPYTVAAPGVMKQRLRHSHSFLPQELHNCYENLNFIENPTSNLFATRHVPNNLIYRTASAAAAQQMADMEYYMHRQQRNHSLNALNLSNSHISEYDISPIYENFPLPSQAKPNEVPRQVSVEVRAPVQPQPRSIQTEPSMDMVSTNMMNSYNNSNKNINDLLNGNENGIYKQQHYLAVNNEMNNGNNMSGSASKINVAQEKDVNLNNIPASTSVSSLFQNQQIKHRQQQNSMMSTSGNSSTYTINTTTTVDTTDSGISTGMGAKKEKSESSKRHKIWNILSGGSKNKQKSATLGREKDKTKKDKKNEINKESETNVHHRWSSGLPKLQPLPANISKEKLCQLLEAKLNDSQLFLEFERIPKRKENAQYSCALMQENHNKNSDRTSLPMDENRVKLIPTRDNRMGYVNASHVTSTVGQKQRFYITAQAPVDLLTANTFFQCVWEADVYLLIQLSDDFTYVPNNSERCLEYGQYQVWREFSQETNKVTTSKLRIYHTQSRRYRSVWHLSWYEFNEQHCPKNLSQFLKFLEELNSVRLASVSEVPPGHNCNPPVMLHCNEGERTGLVLVSDLLLYTLDHNQDLDIPRVIGQLREQRDKIIPSLVQYKFIYSLLIHYLRQTRLI